MKKYKKTPSRIQTAKNSARLGAYLAAGLGASTIATPTIDAAIITIDIGPSGFNIGRVNGGMGSQRINDFPVAGSGPFYVESHYFRHGLSGFNNNNAGGTGILEFARDTSLGRYYSTPRNFSFNELIDNSSTFVSGHNYGTSFRSRPIGVYDPDTYSYFYPEHISPNFGPGSYMGFRTGTGIFGWLEVTWDSTAQEFQILSGAYENVPNVAILAGATATASAAVPEPSTWAMSALLAGGVAFTVWRKRRAAAQAKAQTEPQAV